jgi:hypothetical protein
MSDKKLKKPSEVKPVQWYDPSQLMDTAQRETESETFQINADRRLTYTEWNNKQLEKVVTYKQFTNKDFPPKNDNKDEGFWLDFVADTGDGGNATYSIAEKIFSSTLTNIGTTAWPNLAQKDKDLITNGLPRADLLVLGGDLVYPVANEEAYKTRFYDILNDALPIIQSERDIYDNAFWDEDSETERLRKKERGVIAFPQNHDWYDNLSSFTCLFANEKRETFLDMECPQTQSYHAVQLPYGWWLFGLDFGLSGDIDVYQFEYFKSIIQNDKSSSKNTQAGESTNNSETEESKKETENADNKSIIDENSKIIIVYPEPVWRTTAMGARKGKDWLYRYEHLEQLIEEKTKHAIDIRLAGDQHHYRRYTAYNDLNLQHSIVSSSNPSDETNQPQTHLITCGSGGAFLHPTHGPETFESINHYNDAEQNYYSFENIYGLKYKKYNDYPSKQDSENEHKFWSFLPKNKWFGLITAISYFLLVWTNFSSLIGNVKQMTFNIANPFEAVCYASTPTSSIHWNHDFGWFDNLSCAWQLWSWSIVLSPLSGLIGLFIIFGFMFFAKKFNPHSEPLARLLGFLHGCTHMFAAFLIYYIVLSILDKDPIQSPINFGSFIVSGLLVAFLGYFVGSFIMGGYLFVSLNLYRVYISNTWKISLVATLVISVLIFYMWINDPWDALVSLGILFLPIVLILINQLLEMKKDGFNLIKLSDYLTEAFNLFSSFLKPEKLFLHSSEAFSSLRIQKYKGFLRIKISKDKLQAFFIGIDEIPEGDIWEKNEPSEIPEDDIFQEYESDQIPKWKIKNGHETKLRPKLVDYWEVNR